MRSIALYALPGNGTSGARYLLRQDRFDRDGNLVESTDFRRDGAITSRLVRTYRRGLLRTETRESAGSMERDSHHYDADGAWVRRERYAADGRLLDVKRLVRRESVPLHTIAEEYAERYDSGKWAQDVSHDGDVATGIIETVQGIRLARWRETRDRRGRLLESATWHLAGQSRVRILVYRGDTVVRDTLLLDGTLRESAFFNTTPDGEVVKTVIHHASDGAPLRRIVETAVNDRVLSRETLENSGIAGATELFQYRDEDARGNWLFLDRRNAAGDLLAQRERRIHYF